MCVCVWRKREKECERKGERGRRCVCRRERRRLQKSACNLKLVQNLRKSVRGKIVDHDQTDSPRGNLPENRFSKGDI